MTGVMTLYGEKDEEIGAGGSDGEVLLPVVQAAYVGGGGTIDWSSEPGWSVNLVSTGIFDITFPTSVADAADQSIVATCDSAVTGTSPTVGIHSSTVNTCRVELKNAASGSALSRAFWIHRRVADVPARVSVVADTVENLIINGHFTVNQRVGTRTPGVGVYGFDRWKGHANGLEQVVEYEGPASSVTLSWQGGGTGTVNGVSGTSPVTATVSEDTNFSVIVPDDADYVMCARGKTEREYQYRHKAVELALCQRYFFSSYRDGDAPGTATTVDFIGNKNDGSATDVQGLHYTFPVTMRAVPTITGYSLTGSVGNFSNGGANGNFHEANLGISFITGSDRTLTRIKTTSTIAGGKWLSGFITADAEL
jgi:hypothetical protein